MIVNEMRKSLNSNHHQSSPLTKSHNSKQKHSRPLSNEFPFQSICFDLLSIKHNLISYRHKIKSIFPPYVCPVSRVPAFVQHELEWRWLPGEAQVGERDGEATGLSGEGEL